MVTCSVNASWHEPELSEKHHAATTQGKSGVECTRLGRHCLTNITCQNRRCVCPDNSKGNGLMECVSKDSHLCTVSADPHMMAYRGARVDVNLPCRYRLTRFVTKHRGASSPFAQCTVEVFATNELFNGTYFVRGVHISIGITDMGRQVHHNFEVRKFGTSEEKIYKFLANVSRTKQVWGSSDHESIHGVDVFPFFDQDNNFAVLYVPECDVRIKYRAFSQDEHPQTLLPGISIKAPGDSWFVPGYGTYPQSLCGTDKDGPDMYNIRADHLNMKNKHLAVIHDILNRDDRQLDNPKKAECRAAIHTFADSNDKVGDLKKCGRVLTNTKTRKCLAREGHQPIEVFTTCMRYLKKFNTDDCNLLANLPKACRKSWRRRPKFNCKP